MISLPMLRVHHDLPELPVGCKILERLAGLVQREAAIDYRTKFPGGHGLADLAHCLLEHHSILFQTTNAVALDAHVFANHQTWKAVHRTRVQQSVQHNRAAWSARTNMIAHSRPG